MLDRDMCQRIGVRACIVPTLWYDYGSPSADGLLGALYLITTHCNVQQETWGQGLTLPYLHYPKRIILSQSGARDGP
jgi:hypothetical protein